MSDFEKLKDKLKDKLTNAKSLKEVELVRDETFGKNGLINLEFKKLGSLSQEDKKRLASEINNAKQELIKLFNDKAIKLADSEIEDKVKKEKDDVTLPEKDFRIGKIHPVSQVIDEISSIFSEIGFSVEEGPDVESEYYNFTALNTPENHPAKDMHDTFYIEENMKTLLRTHTSPVQVRTMLKGKPPFKIIVPACLIAADSAIVELIPISKIGASIGSSSIARSTRLSSTLAAKSVGKIILSLKSLSIALAVSTVLWYESPSSLTKKS